MVEAAFLIDAGKLDRAAVLVAHLSELGERHGFDMWLLMGAGERAAVDGLAAAETHGVDPSTLAGHIAAFTTLLDTLRAFEANIFSTALDGVLARLLMAAHQPEQARRQLDEGLQLAHNTGMHYYDAELLRLRARTHDDPPAQRADLEAALELARHQGAHLFELRAALDDFELRGELARAPLADAVSRLPDDSTIPEVARARAAI